MKKIYLLLLCLPFLGFAQSHTVTFQVNTQNITVGPNGIYAGGGVLGGSNAVALSDPDADGVWEGSTQVSGAGGGHFVFLNSPNGAADWGTKENLAGKPCADPANYNDRQFPAFSQDTTLMFCFGSCETDGTCPAAATPVDVTFQLDMTNNPGDSAFIRGASFNGWAMPGIPMEDNDGDGIWEKTLNMVPGIYEYKYVGGTAGAPIDETLDPVLDSACTLTTGIYTNRIVDVGTVDTIVPPNCFEDCGSCGNPPPPASGCSDLFFSEYSEGSSNNKYIEIYNPTANAVALAGYTVYTSGNGGSFTNTFPLSGTLASGDVYMISTDQSDASILAAADTSLGFPSIVHFNGDDALLLVNGSDTLDIIGVPGVDPGQSWPVDTGSTKEYTLVRKVTIDGGSTDWSVGATEWDVYPQNTWTDMGMHTSNCASSPPPSTGCTELFFSEYAEGSSNNKYIEVYNPTGSPVSLTGYTVYTSGNGGSFTNTFVMSGTLASGDVYMITTDQADPSIQAAADTSLGFPSIVHFNGDDALILVNGSDTLDVIGEPGIDPGSEWPVGTGSTKDFTLVRMSTIDAGSTDWSTGAAEWDVYPQNTWTDMGMHTSNCASSPPPPPPPPTGNIPTYAIADVTGIDAGGVADSLGVECKLIGTVMGIDMQGSTAAIQFTIHDGIDGIGCYSSAPGAQAYSVMEGDQVRLIGSIGQFNGLTQIYPDSIAFISSGNPLPTATVVTQLGENTESELVTFKSATLVDPSQWSGSGSGFNVDITNGTDTIALRIDNDVDLYSQPAPTGAFDVTGIGGQFTFNIGNFDGYQLLPRYTADIVPAAAVYVPKLVVSEIMPGSNATSWNADWFEIHNYGDTLINLAGMSWDDESGISGTVGFPSVDIAPGEAVVVWDDVAANEDSLLVSWKLYPGSVQVISTDEMTGSFPSLSQNGDGIYLFDAAGIELTNSTYASASAGVSVEFDSTGASMGDAVDGVNGAYTSLNGDVGSPGNLTPNTNAGELTLIGRIYPNPNTGAFKIEMGIKDNYTVEVMDVRGSVLSKTSVEGNIIPVEINASPGMYLVRVSSAEGTVTQRVQVL